jgi:REP element-mobilizing transposase RayT
VLRTVQKHAAEANVLTTNEVPCQQDAVLRTPVTPVSADGLISLQTLIMQKDAHALDETSRQALQRHLQKFAKAAHLSFTKGALQQNHIHLLMSINNEAKTRRSTKSEVLAKGSGKVMSYEDLQEARAKRARKDTAKEANKGTRGRPRKGTAPEVEALEAVTTVPEVAATAPEIEAGPLMPKSKEKRSGKRKSTALEEADIDAGTSVPKGKVARTGDEAATNTEVLWRAPLAKMY